MKYLAVLAVAAMAAFVAQAGKVGVWSGISTAGSPNWTVVCSGNKAELFERESTSGYPVVEYTGGEKDGFIRERGGSSYRYWQGVLYYGSGMSEKDKICNLQNDREIMVGGQRLGRFDVGNEGRFNCAQGGSKTYTWKGGVIPIPMRVYLATVKYCGIKKPVNNGAKPAVNKSAANENPASAKKVELPPAIFKVYEGEATAGLVAKTYRDKQLWDGGSMNGAPEVTLEWKSWSFFQGTATSGEALYTYAKGQFLRGDAKSTEVLLSVDNDSLVVSRHNGNAVEQVGKWDNRDFAVFRDMSGKVLMTVSPVEANGKRMDVPSKYYSLWNILKAKSGSGDSTSGNKNAAVGNELLKCGEAEIPKAAAGLKKLFGN